MLIIFFNLIDKDSKNEIIDSFLEKANPTTIHTNCISI